MDKKIVRSVLDGLAAKHGGVLRPDLIVEHARDPDSPMHDYFVWDDTDAARRFRLFQAEKLIRTIVVEIPVARQEAVEVRAFESLPSDRLTGGGYRPIQSIMSNEQFRKELIASAMKELSAFQKRYRQLSELTGIFDEINKLKKSA